MPGAFSVDLRDALKQLGDAKRLSANVTKPAADYMRSITPIRTGNARAHTYASSETEIDADYSYAEKLDQGYSKQAPEGMSEKTIQYIEKLVERELTKLGK